MTVLLVLATFLVFALLDYLLSRGEAPVRVLVEKPVHVEGFHMPEGIRYHPGHAWLLRERKNVVRVGADEFAAALAGKIEKIELPKPGQWIRQGQKAWALFRNGQKTEMVSPTEGEVVEINQEVIDDPSLLRREPYGRGWLLTIHVPDEESTTRNLIPQGLARTWLRSAAEKLYAMQPQLAGAVAAEAGEPAEDLLEGLPEVSWAKVTREYFLT